MRRGLSPACPPASAAAATVSRRLSRRASWSPSRSPRSTASASRSGWSRCSPRRRPSTASCPTASAMARPTRPAILGALGEIAEMVWPTLTPVGARQDPRQLCRPGGRASATTAIADPLTLCLPAGSPVGRDTPLDWVEARRWADGSTVLVPIDLAAYSAKELSPGYRPFTTIISNGMGAGPDLDWAIGHGLLRDPAARRQRPAVPRPRPGRRCSTCPIRCPTATAALLDRFAAAGIRADPQVRDRRVRHRQPLLRRPSTRRTRAADADHG